MRKYPFTVAETIKPEAVVPAARRVLAHACFGVSTRLFRPMPDDSDQGSGEMKKTVEKGRAQKNAMQDKLRR